MYLYYTWRCAAAMLKAQTGLKLLICNYSGRTTCPSSFWVLINHAKGAVFLSPAFFWIDMLMTWPKKKCILEFPLKWIWFMYICAAVLHLIWIYVLELNLKFLGVVEHEFIRSGAWFHYHPAGHHPSPCEIEMIFGGKIWFPGIVKFI